MRRSPLALLLPPPSVPLDFSQELGRQSADLPWARILIEFSGSRKTSTRLAGPISWGRPTHCCAGRWSGYGSFVGATTYTYSSGSFPVFDTLWRVAGGI